jgi:hypothetical protein
LYSACVTPLESEPTAGAPNSKWWYHEAADKWQENFGAENLQCPAAWIGNSPPEGDETMTIHRGIALILL